MSYDADLAKDAVLGGRKVEVRITRTQVATVIVAADAKYPEIEEDLLGGQMTVGDIADEWVDERDWDTDDTDFDYKVLD